MGGLSGHLVGHCSTLVGDLMGHLLGNEQKAVGHLMGHLVGETTGVLAQRALHAARRVPCGALWAPSLVLPEGTEELHAKRGSKQSCRRRLHASPSSACIPVARIYSAAPIAKQTSRKTNTGRPSLWVLGTPRGDISCVLQWLGYVEASLSPRLPLTGAEEVRHSYA